MLALGHASGRGHQQRKAEIGGGFGQHVGRVGGLHACRGHGGHVKVVEAHGHVGHDPELGVGLQDSGIDAFAAGGQCPHFALQAAAEFGGGEDVIGLVVVDIEHLAQPGQDFREDGAGHQDGGFAHFSSFCRQWVIWNSRMYKAAPAK